MAGIKKIGLYGGTFNPIHNGHLKVITHVKKGFGLDTIHLIPSARPPHKSAKNLASAADRLRMVQDAVADLPGLAASDIELKRQGSSYTIDTLRQFMQHLAHQVTPGTPPIRLYFILGTDAFFDMTTWKEADDIFRIAHLIIMTRAGDNRTPSDIENFLQTTISSQYRGTLSTVDFGHSPPHIQNGHLENFPCEARHHDYISPDCVARIDSDTTNPEFKAVYICNVPEIPISSTEIRKRIKQKQSISGLVPQCVERLIIQKGLYFDN